VGRARSVLGPYVDNMGQPLLKGGGKLVISARGRTMGPGHFGLIDLGGGLQKMSMHYEADLDRSGRSVLAIEPLLWRDGWPVVGANVRAGNYEIKSERSGNALQLQVDFVRIPFEPRRSFMAKPTDPVAPMANQSLADMANVIPPGATRVDLSAYMARPNQQWTITPVPEAGGYFGAPFYRIGIAGTERVLAARKTGEVESVPAYTGATEQLWRIDQLTDGSYRITPASAIADDDVALVAIGVSTVSLARFDPRSDTGRWRFMEP
jgi:arabinan endo-1,5-alpha-L-arabinosidase